MNALLTNKEKQALIERIGRNFVHEVGNPLSSMSLAIGNLEEDLKLEDRDSLKILESSLDKISRLLKDFHHAIRSPTLDKKRIVINQLIDEVVKAIQETALLRGVAIHTQLNAGDFVIEGDKELLKIALLHLFTNALESTEIKQGKLFLTSTQEGQRCSLTIKDNGCGIASDHLNQIFEPFFTQKKGRTGLGLTHAQSILLAHDVNIDVSSKLEEGTIVSLLFFLDKD